MKLSSRLQEELSMLVDDARTVDCALHPAKHEKLSYNQEKLQGALIVLSVFGTRVLEEENSGPKNIRKTD